jgi:inner membrane protein involved in colicin E2 resistance
MKKLVENFVGFSLFIGLFLILLIPLMLTGAIIRPVRYFRHVVDKVHNKKVKEYYY